MNTPVYLDYAATTPVDERVVEAMTQCLTRDGLFANPASGHAPGRAARERVEEARAELAALLGAEPRELVFTSGATESNNLAIAGAARFHARHGRHLITSRTEHRAVIDVCAALEREGFEVTWLEPGKEGIIQPDQVQEALREDTVLVSLMHANNELGTVQDIAAIGEILRPQGVLFHVDAAQSAGKLPLDLAQLPVDLLSVSAHKFYGPKGIGALYQRRRPRARVSPLIHGGGHERGLRSGTLATHQIVGLGMAARIAREEMAEEGERLRALRQRLLDGLCQRLDGVHLNGAAEPRLPGLINLRFAGVHGEALLAALDPHVSLSSGSACASATAEPSYVLRALGLTDAEAEASLRFSLGRFSTEAEVDDSIAQVVAAVERLRAISPRGMDAAC